MEGAQNTYAYTICWIQKIVKLCFDKTFKFQTISYASRTNSYLFKSDIPHWRSVHYDWWKILSKHPKQYNTRKCNKTAGKDCLQVSNLILCETRSQEIPAILLRNRNLVANATATEIQRPLRYHNSSSQILFGFGKNSDKG